MGQDFVINALRSLVVASAIHQGLNKGHSLYRIIVVLLIIDYKILSLQ